MKNLAVELRQLDSEAGRIRAISNQISDIKNRFNGIKNTLDWDIRSKSYIDDNLRNVYRELDDLDDRLYQLGDVIRMAGQAYNQAETKLTRELLDLDDIFAKTPSGSGSGVESKNGGEGSNPYIMDIGHLQGIIGNKVDYTDQSNTLYKVYGPLDSSIRFINEDMLRYMVYSPAYLYANSKALPESFGWDLDFSTYESPSTQVGIISTSIDSATDLGIQYIPSIIKNTPRPNNIGIGTWNKMIASQTDDVVKSMKFMNKGAKFLGFAGVGLDVGTNIYNNVQNGTDGQRIATDAYVDTALGLGGLLASAKAGAAVGSFFTPGIGTAVGFCVGIGFAFITDSIKINGLSIREYLKEGIDAIADITVDTARILADTAVETVGIVMNTVSETADIVSDSIMDTANIVNDAVARTSGIVGDALIETQNTITNAAIDTANTVTGALYDTADTVTNAMIDTIGTVNDTLMETTDIVNNALSDAADAIRTADNVGEALLDSTYIVTDAVSDTLDVVNEALDETINTVNTAISDTMDTVNTALSDTADIINNAVADTMDTFSTAAAETYDVVSDAVSDTIDTVSDAVSDTVDTVTGAVSDTMDSLAGAVDDVAGSIADRIGSWFD